MKFHLLSFFLFAASLDAFGQGVSTMSGQIGGSGPTAAQKAPADPVKDSEFDCNVSCQYQNGYESALVQMTIMQKKSDLLTDESKHGTDLTSPRVAEEIEGFCTQNQYNREKDPDGRGICYKKAQLFMAASIQNYQSAMKQIANDKAGLTWGRQADGSLGAGDPKVADSGINAVPHTFHIPQASELRAALLKAYKTTGVFEIKEGDMKKQWDQLFYVGGDPKRAQVFDGRAAKMKDVDGRGSTSADKKSQVFSLKTDGSVEKVKELVAADKNLHDAYIKQGGDKIADKSMAVKRNWNIDLQNPATNGGKSNSISYDAFMHTRNGLAETFEGGVKALDTSRAPAAKGATSATTAGAAAKPAKGVSASTVDVKAVDKNASTGTNYGKYGEEGQANIKSTDTSYGVTHGGLGTDLSSNALGEATK